MGASVHAGYTAALGVEAVEAVGEVVQLLGEQVAVAVQRERGGLVAQGLYVLKAGPAGGRRGSTILRQTV